jgi:hypothetical protein
LRRTHGEKKEKNKPSSCEENFEKETHDQSEKEKTEIVPLAGQGRSLLGGAPNV